MVKIRLRRTGAKKQPHYRVVVADSRSPRDGKFIETIGHYNPRTEPPTVEIDAERALYWLGVGAQPSEAVRRMLDKMGIMAQAAAVRKGEVSVGEVLTQLEPSEEARPLEEAAIEEEISDIEEEVLEAEAYLFDEEVETAFETEEELFEGEDEEEDEEEDWEEDAEEEEDFEEEDEFFEDEDEDEDWDEDEDEDDDDEEESE